MSEAHPPTRAVVDNILINVILVSAIISSL